MYAFRYASRSTIKRANESLSVGIKGVQDMNAETTGVLTKVLERHSVETVSLPAPDLHKRRGQILLMDEVSAELHAVSSFADQVRSEYSRIAGTSIANAVADA